MVVVPVPCPRKNAGWRIDYFLVSNRLQPQLTDANIHNEVFGSDHCPVEVDIDFDRHNGAPVQRQSKSA